MKTVERTIVGGFIFSNNEKVLLGQNEKGGVYQGMWVVPGGGVEQNETPRDALRREMLEEVGIDVDAGDVRQLDGESQGTSEKYIKDLGETALVVMTFLDFEVRLNQPAESIAVLLEDDLVRARWFSREELNDLTISEPTRRRLVELGMIE